jgi:anti-sigma regulatory factor (Ser/Thr protein kinase)
MVTERSQHNEGPRLDRFLAFDRSGGVSRFGAGARRVWSTFGKLALELSWTSAAQRSASEVPVESIEFSLEAEASAPGAARRFLRRALATQNLDGFGDVSELLTTELVTNVVLHARSPITVRLLTSGDRLRVEVDDASNKALVPQPADPERPSGKGLLLVDKLASDWGVDTRADGKTVWFEIDTSTATDEIHGDSP